MICDRCGQRILPDEKYDARIPDSMSGARPTAYVHREPCRRPVVEGYSIRR
ncbi:hypothetical protein ACIA6D_23755 [Streptomyces cacaoi]